MSSNFTPTRPDLHCCLKSAAGNWKRVGAGWTGEKGISIRLNEDSLPDVLGALVANGGRLSLFPHREAERRSRLTPKRKKKQLAWAVRQRVVQRDAGVCQRCGRQCARNVPDWDKTWPCVVHKIQPRCGGTDHPDNLELLCYRCFQQRPAEADAQRPDEGQR